jgi:molybdenum cofactor synthesis domain-containing protein
MTLKSRKTRLMTGEMEIVCIGNELLIGKIANTNAQWMSRRTALLGITVRRITVVPDEIEDIATAIREAMQRRAQFIITTGGLGPTFDDKTLQGLSKALNRRLEVNKEALKMVREKYEAYLHNGKTENGDLTPPRVKMATIPEGTKPVPNPIGTAPAVLAETDAAFIVSLPGVPREMEAIFDETVAPMLKEASRDVSFYEKSIYADKIMESNIAPMIDQVMRDNPLIYIKSHPRGMENRPHLEIHLSLRASYGDRAEERLERAASQLAHLITQQGGKVVTGISPAE